MAKSTAMAKTGDKAVSAAIANRPSYLPVVSDDADINKINQRAGSLPTLSINNNVWTLLENKVEIHTFVDDDGKPLDELEFYFLHIHFDTQRRAYEEAWDEDDPQDPICFSDDGLVPVGGVPDPQSKDCASCWRSADDTKRTDKCAWFRNSIVVVEYVDANGQEVRVMARLRINGGSLFGEENRSSGEINAESLIRQYKSLNAELWYHPVVAFFDTTSKGAQNKLLFEILLQDYPSEDLAQSILDFKAQQDYVALTQLKVRNSDDVGDESSEKEAGKAPNQRKAAKKKSSSGKTAGARSKRSAKKDTESDDSERSDTAAGSGDSGEEETNTRGKGRSKRQNGRENGASKQGGESETADGDVSDDSQPDELLNDPAVADLIGDVDLP